MAPRSSFNDLFKDLRLARGRLSSHVTWSTLQMEQMSGGLRQDVSLTVDSLSNSDVAPVEKMLPLGYLAVYCFSPSYILSLWCNTVGAGWRAWTFT